MRVSENAIIYYTDESTIMIVITQSPWFLFVKVTRSFITLDSNEDKCYFSSTKYFYLLYLLSVAN